MVATAKKWKQVQSSVWEVGVKWNVHMNDTIVCESSLERQLIIHRIAMKNFLSLSLEQTL